MNEFKKALDAASQEALTEPPRTHLGASSIGKKCARQVWYGWRWAHRTKHGGRMMRLFNRGHDEEHRVVRWLRAMPGVQVQDYAQRLMYHEGSDSYVCIDWGAEDDEAWAECDDVHDDPVHIKRAADRNQGPKQWGFRIDVGAEPWPVFDKFGNPSYSDKGHYAGSGDGRLIGIEEWFPEVTGKGWGLWECKTHNDKSFGNLVKKGVLSAKPEHYSQMQQYMHFFGLKWGLYTAVNKNDDDIYVEVIHYKPEVAEYYADRAMKILTQRVPPAKLTEDPSWFECRYCDFREVCHYQKDMQKSCRSCIFAIPIQGGEWECTKYRQIIPKDFIPKGCDDWEQID